MMGKLKKSLKNFLYSKYFPDFLFALHFYKKEQKNRNQLLQLIDKETNLLDALKENQQAHWELRIQKVLDAPENINIPRAHLAGTLNDKGNLIMHNNIQIDPLSYYSFPLLKMLIQNKGVHEPEEERIFQEVIKSMAATKDMTMLELGSYWSFYSMWFLSLFPNAKCIMAEPDRKNLFYGKKNFKLNNLKGTFIHTGISSNKDKKQNLTTVDDICKENKVKYLDILHSDIQGYELEMLEGSKRMLIENKVGYVFISTHSNELHADCRNFLLNFNFEEVANVDLDQSSSWDGILVMKSPNYKGISNVDLLTKVGGRV